MKLVVCIVSLRGRKDRQSADQRMQLSGRNVPLDRTGKVRQRIAPGLVRLPGPNGARIITRDAQGIR